MTNEEALIKLRSPRGESALHSRVKDNIEERYPGVIISASFGDHQKHNEARQ